MEKFNVLAENELMEVDGGALEILIGGKVISGIAAGATIGGVGLVLVGVGALAWYVASKN